MEPLAMSTNAMQTSPTVAGHHPHLGHMHRPLLHQAWGFPHGPGSPAAVLQNQNSPAPPENHETPGSYEASEDERSQRAASGVGGGSDGAHDDSGISPGRTSSSGPSSHGGSPHAASASRDSEHAPSPPRAVKPEPSDPADDECRSSPVTHDDDSSEMSEDTVDSLSRLQMALSQSGSPLGDIYNAPSDDHQQVAAIQCPLCSVTASSLPALAAHLSTHVEQKSDSMLCSFCNHVCSSHEDFVVHLGSHYFQQDTSSRKPQSVRRCSVCDFTTKSATKLKSHLAEFHGFAPGDNDVDMNEEEDVNTPRVNSQGKVKTFRCKQCNFVAVTKLDFWSHTRSHIKNEKMLSCPRCPFVTEYKHHLEYHLRNHSGSKPFKCSQCSYSCVNKSMLNSHLKSHSNVYQYRCADCNYATKYCHSLKLHLRKYTHQPAMVLNPDGSPNPLPIIDVYGTRRGPKTKKQVEVGQHENHQARHPKSPVMVPAYPSIPVSQAYLANPSPVAQEVENPHKCAQCDFSTSSQEHFAQHLLTAHTASKPHTPPILIPTPEKMVQPHPIMIPQPNPMKEYIQWMYAQQKHAMDLYQQYKGATEVPEPVNPANPLDLSKEVRRSEPEMLNNNLTPTNKSSRRKGKAFKLERLSVPEEETHDDDLKAPPSKITITDINENREVVPSPVLAVPRSPEVTQVSSDITPVKPSKVIEPESPKEIANDNGVPPVLNSTTQGDNQPTYNCGYCDILFRDVVMYTMHMGYHGYKDPFHCNMCGQQTSDKLSFFLHIARSSHC
ncbi:hypothetical protein B566_EDAN014277 [Ephemera danica]|nr:hypothetical protein B566_EDAN014277 [Ephemera danica]